MLDHGKIMRDKQIRQPHFSLQLHQQIDDLCLNGNIQRRDRLITHNKLWIYGKRARDADTLPLAAGKFMGKAICMLAVQPHHFQQLIHACRPLCLAAAQSMDIQALGNNICNSHTRIKRRIRILKNNLCAAAEFPFFCAAQRVHVDSVEKYLAACLVVQAHRRTTAGRFSAAGLTHHAKRFPAIDCK